jgi:hypothetical protein
MSQSKPGSNPVSAYYPSAGQLPPAAPANDDAFIDAVRRCPPGRCLVIPSSYAEVSTWEEMALYLRTELSGAQAGEWKRMAEKFQQRAETAEAELQNVSAELEHREGVWKQTIHKMSSAIEQMSTAYKTLKSKHKLALTTTKRRWYTWRLADKNSDKYFAKLAFYRWLRYTLVLAANSLLLVPLC